MKTYKTLPDGTQIVEYEDSLAPALAEMWNRSGEGWGGASFDGIWTAEQVIAKRSSGAFFNVFVAMKNGEALGYCSFDRYFKDADTAYVHLLNVRPDHHGRKIGKALVLMCVEETIALGMPRLDIHTWPGNTKSVPLYKKCGFLWEDRTDTTHLLNFVPTVLQTELTKGFFDTADWYEDNTRKIVLKPDGVKKDKFEFFEYSWEKDGRSLRVGFEKTGRKIRLVETDDYMIEFTADNHELAFGVGYGYRFRIKNKTGLDLNVSVTAKNDGVISSSGAWSGLVIDEAIYEGTFFVNAIDDDLDPERIHPCVLADIVINGKHAEFGLGIAPKFPISISLHSKYQIAKPGSTEDVYINIKNTLPRDAAINFSLDDNPLMRLNQTEYSILLAKGRDVMLETRAIITNCGYIRLPVAFDVTLETGEQIKLTRPLHLVNQGLYGQFGFETDEHHCAANGLWRLKLSKLNNTALFDRIVPSGHGEFPVSRLGKPYDDEFNIAKPSEIRVTNGGEFIRLEADFESGKFTGAVLTESYEFDAAGTLRSGHKVSNTGKTTLDLTIKSEFWTNIGPRAVYPYDGGVHEVADSTNHGFATLDSTKIDENWIFDSTSTCPTGVFWPPQYKPTAKWANQIELEFPTGALDPGQSFKAEPVVYMCGVFKNYTEFRDYVLGISSEDTPPAHNHLEIITNGHNPVLSSDSLRLVVRNNRLNVRQGDITVSSPDNLFAPSMQENPVNELCPENIFTLPVEQPGAGLTLVDYSINHAGFHQTVKRALLVADDTNMLTDEQEGVLTVTNGNLSFSVAQGFSDTMYSLRLGGNEWLHSLYPSHEPYSWWNPYIGGLKTYIQRFGSSLIQREKITASFTTKTDALGNVWKGIRADVTVENFDLYKGMHLTQYYLTLAGAPVICHFMRLDNNMGRYIDADLFSMLFLSGKEDLQDIEVTLADVDKTDYIIRLGKDDNEIKYDKLAVLSRGGNSLRPEKLYVFKDSAWDRGEHIFGYDLNTAFFDFNMKGRLPDGGRHTTKPIILIATEKDLTQESLTDFSRIDFR